MGDEENATLLRQQSIGGTFEAPKVAGLSWAGEIEAPDAPEKTGDIVSSAMNLAACALGSSMLSLPYTMMVAGPVTSFALLLSFAVMSYYAAESIVQGYSSSHACHRRPRCLISRDVDIRFVRIRVS